MLDQRISQNLLKPLSFVCHPHSILACSLWKTIKPFKVIILLWLSCNYINNFVLNRLVV
jgi:hypothetical protein